MRLTQTLIDAIARERGIYKREGLEMVRTAVAARVMKGHAPESLKPLMERLIDLPEDYYRLCAKVALASTRHAYNTCHYTGEALLRDVSEEPLKPHEERLSHKALKFWTKAQRYKRQRLAEDRPGSFDERNLYAEILQIPAGWQIPMGCYSYVVDHADLTPHRKWSLGDPTSGDVEQYYYTTLDDRRAVKRFEYQPRWGAEWDAVRELAATCEGVSSYVEYQGGYVIVSLDDSIYDDGTFSARTAAEALQKLQERIADYTALPPLGPLGPEWSKALELAHHPLICARVYERSTMLIVKAPKWGFQTTSPAYAERELDTYLNGDDCPWI